MKLVLQGDWCVVLCLSFFASAGPAFNWIAQCHRGLLLLRACCVPYRLASSVSCGVWAAASASACAHASSCLVARALAKLALRPLAVICCCWWVLTPRFALVQRSPLTSPLSVAPSRLTRDHYCPLRRALPMCDCVVGRGPYLTTMCAPPASAHCPVFYVFVLARARLLMCAGML